MVVDCGGGTTDVAVLSIGGVVESDSIKAGGETFDEELIKYIRRKHNVLIGDNTAEELKKSIGCVFPRGDVTTLEVKGRCLMTGLPRVVQISTDEVLEAFGEMSERIIEVIHRVLENTPPELVADVSQNGIVLTGGGSLLWGFDKLIESRTHIPTRLADDAELCVAYGLGKSLQWVGDMHEGTINLSRRKQMKN
jgi:rod shape-determining protein MreB